MTTALPFSLQSIPSADSFAELIIAEGCFCHHGTTLEEFLDRFDRDGRWWDDSAETAAILSSQSFRDEFRSWIALRYAWALDRLTEELDTAGGLNLVRAMDVERGWQPAETVGLFWALDCGAEVSAYNSSKFALTDPVEVLLHATVTPDLVNWPETLRSRMDYLNGDDEAEVQLLPGVVVPVSSIEVDLQQIEGVATRVFLSATA